MLRFSQDVILWEFMTWLIIFNYLGSTNEQLLAQKDILEQQKKEKLDILIATKVRYDILRFKEQKVSQNAIDYSHTLK